MQFHFSRMGPPAASPPPAPSRSPGQAAGSVLPPLDDEARARPRPSPAPGEHPDSGTAAAAGAKAEAASGPRTIGKYLVSPLIKALENGWFASSVSIRSGSGSGTTDRILRLTRLFRCATEAATFAHAEALQWISTSGRPAAA